MKAAGLKEYTYTIDDDETGEAKKLRVAYEEETETTLTVRTVKEKKAKAEKAAA
jgi:ribulose 1,5-bisphosphate carboxylase large subunit-like protein